MSFFQSPWFVPTMVIIVLFCIVYLLLSPSRQRQQNKVDRDVREGKQWSVQCPRCGRWKELRPTTTTRMQNPEHLPSTQPGMQHKFTNEYKCPFCGHHWKERYVE